MASTGRGSGGGGGGGGGVSLDDMLAHCALLGLAPDADVATIKKAYRDKARDLHPDKNPDDPHAAAKFDAVNKAMQALTDTALRAEFERKLAARAAVAARYADMDARKRKLREELEARERAGASGGGGGRGGGAPASTSGGRGSDDGEGGLVDHHQRLRRKVQDEVAAMMEEVARQRRAAVTPPSSSPADPLPSHAPSTPASPPPPFQFDRAVKVKWSDAVNGARGEDRSVDGSGLVVPTLSEAQVEADFSRYGPVSCVLSKKVRSAIVVFDATSSAVAAVAAPPATYSVTTMARDGGGVAEPPTAGGDGGQVMGEAGGATVGWKRPRPVEGVEEDGRAATASWGGLPGQGAQPPSKRPSVGTGVGAVVPARVDLQAKEAATFALLKAAAAAKKGAAATPSTAPT